MSLRVWFWVSLVLTVVTLIAAVVDRDIVWLLIAGVNGHNAYNFRKILNE